MAYRLINAVFSWLYQYGAWLYDPLVRLLFGRAWYEWQSCILDDIVPGLILDVGCGTGVFTAVVQHQIGRVVGLDRSRTMLRQAHRRHKVAMLVCADARALPLRDNICTTVLSTFPADYILDPGTGQEIVRVLRPEGKIIVVAAAQLTSRDRRFWLVRFAQQLLRMRAGTAAEGAVLPPLVTHPMVCGEWQRRITPSGIVWVWIGQRLSQAPEETKEA